MKENPKALLLAGAIAISCLLPVRLAAGGLDTRIYSSNHAYSTPDKKQTSTLRIAMKPSASVPDSAIEVYLFAASQDETSHDGIPDYNAFDIDGITLECPRSIPGVFEFGSPQILPADESKLVLNEGFYHRLICPYTGTGDVSQADFGFDNDNYLTISGLTNPLGDPKKDPSQLILSPIWVNFSAAVAQLTITSGRNVEMLATISPQISLVLEGLPGGETYCGVINEATTSGRKAAFPNVINEKFSNVAQRLTATTNMANGYVLTAIQDDQMRRTDTPDIICKGDGSTNDGCIPDSQAPGISSSQAVIWEELKTARGLGFTLQNEYGDDTLFDYRDGYRTFADAQNGDEPVAIMKSVNGRLGVNYVCYRVVAAEDNQPGFYANNLTYTLTAKF